jgi:hypothetical protein
MKGYKIVIVFLFGLGTLFLIYQLILANAEISNLERERDYFRNAKSVLQQKVWDVSCINILMINKMCPRDQRKLQKDEDYMNIVTKMN